MGQRQETASCVQAPKPDGLLLAITNSLHHARESVSVAACRLEDRFDEVFGCNPPSGAADCGNELMAQPADVSARLYSAATALHDEIRRLHAAVERVAGL